MILTRVQFAARLAQFGMNNASWCHSVLTQPDLQLNQPMDGEPVARFIRETRMRLDDLERELDA